MFISLELSAIKGEVESLLSAFVRNSLSSVYKTAYDLIAGFSDMKIYISFLYIYVYINIYTHKSRNVFYL